MTPVLTCEQFSISIQGKPYSCDGFNINKGEIIHLFAPSEFAAQNFLLLIAGLHKERELTNPGSNNNLERQKVEISDTALSFIKLDALELYSIEKINRARKIGYIFENPDIAIFGRTIKEDFFQSLALTNKSPDSTMLIKYGLYEKLDRQTNVLSGGEKHRLICANALERKPSLIIADFSSSNLDKIFLYEFLNWVSSYCKDLGGSVLLHGLTHEELNTFNGKIIKYFGCPITGKIERKDPAKNSFPLLPHRKNILKNKLNQRKTGDIIHVFKDVHVPEFNTKPISFDLYRNEILIIEGSNGCGKTTLGKIITKKIRKYNGLIQPVIKRAGISLQFPERSFNYWNIWDELPNEQLLNLCGIKNEKWQDHPRNLSRSQQKLLSIASALLYSTGITILDEPTTGLDFEHKVKLIDILNHFENLTIIVFNHDPMLTNISRTIKFI